MTVVDASVAVKWFVREHLSATALSLLGAGVSLLAPSLVRLEVTAAIVRHHNEGTFDKQRATSACERLENVLALKSLVLTRNTELWDDAMKLSIQIKHPFPDCLYLALAARENMRLITADEKMCKRGRKVGIDTMMLEELEASASVTH